MESGSETAGDLLDRLYRDERRARRSCCATWRTQATPFIEPTAEEIEAIVGSVRVVSDDEWRTRLATVHTGASGESDESSDAGDAPATTVPE